MNIRKKAAALSVSAMIFTSFLPAFASEPEINIQLDGFVSRQVERVWFSGVKPMQIDSVTYVPIRAFAEAAGMEVTWDQPTQTALITLRTNSNSDKPIEKYASELIDQIGGYGLDLTPADITASLKLNNRNAVLRFNFTDSEGDTVAIGKTIEMSNAARLINDASLVIPIRNAMELFGLDIDWHQETLTAEISIPNKITVPTELKIIANHSSVPDENPMTFDEYMAKFGTGVHTVDVKPNDPPDLGRGKYIGRFKITLYCPCEICNGGWGAHTAWAGEIIPGQTIAVDPDVIGKLTWVYIDGVGLRRAEDCGGAVKGYHIDLAVSSHDEVTNGQVTYKDVYYAE